MLLKLFAVKMKTSELLRRCYTAATASTHPTSHIAALLVKNDTILIEAVNNFSPGVHQTPERVTGANRHHYPNHAERAAIYMAAKQGIATKNLTLVAPWPPCIDCANAIIMSGINHVILHKTITELMPEAKRAKDLLGLELLQEADIQVTFYDKPLGMKAYRSGKTWNV